MPKQIYFTKKLVYSSPSDQRGDEKLYRTQFGLVREDAHRNLYIWREKKWVRLWEERGGQLLLVQGQLNEAGLPREAYGLAASTVYEGTADYLLDKLKTYWWTLLPLAFAVGVVTTLHASPLWISAIFIAIISFIIYQERHKSGIKKALICLLLGLATFAALSFLIEIIYVLLQALQVIMGLCDGINCEAPHFWLKSDPHYDPDLAGGRGRYGL
ncbi:hypothetical protein [Alcaligenes faecalis]|uniref:hypothetical protein n=1 Tax=Alcaligenes faecalis TaxID=511 RepID=UPI00293276C7|nr:hypothetical protein [Alcaligenes faecalis]MDV2116467.1 hypothetical protein [Alcaligenes faecalis]